MKNIDLLNNIADSYHNNNVDKKKVSDILETIIESLEISNIHETNTQYIITLKHNNVESKFYITKF